MEETALQRLRRLIFRRRGAYRALFQPGGLSSPAAHIVLSDLRTFCRAASTPAVVSQVNGTIDPIATGIAIGRLEVWQRITQNLHLSDADLYKLVDQDE